MFTIEVDMGDTAAFAQRSAGKRALSLLANIPHSPLAFVKLVETRGNDGLVVYPLELLALGASVAGLG